MKCDLCSDDRHGVDLLCATCRETMNRLVRISAAERGTESRPVEQPLGSTRFLATAAKP